MTSLVNDAVHTKAVRRVLALSPRPCVVKPFFYPMRHQPPAAVRWMVEVCDDRRSADRPRSARVVLSPAQVNVVIVMLGYDDEFYSAGEEWAPGAVAPRPEGGIPVVPRPEGEPPGGGRDLVEWAVEVRVAAPDGEGERRAEEVQRLLQAAPVVNEGGRRSHTSGYGVDCIAAARSSEAAMMAFTRRCKPYGPRRTRARLSGPEHARPRPRPLSTAHRRRRPTIYHARTHGR